MHEDHPTPPPNYHRLLMVLPIPVMVMEADQTISFINPAFEKTFGWTLEEIRDRLLDFVPEDQLFKTATGKLSLIKNGELNNFETQRYTKDGRLLDVIYDGARIYDAGNRPSGLIITLKDITQRKRAESINQRLYQEIKSLNKAKDSIIDRLSHELQTPLAVIRASLHLLAASSAKVNTENTSRIVQRVEKNIKRLLDMQRQLNDIKANSPTLQDHMMTHLVEQCFDELENILFIEVGESVGRRIRQKIEKIYFPPQVDSQIIDLGPFVDTVINKIKPAFAHRLLDLRTDLQDTATIRIPSAVLEKIVIGLTKNAVENTPDGGKIEISIKRQANIILFHICDTGVGITKENKQLLFKSYFTTRDVYTYSTRQPYDFNAGGNGFELLRLNIFSERYHFQIGLTSTRCPLHPHRQRHVPGKRFGLHAFAKRQ